MDSRRAARYLTTAVDASCPAGSSIGSIGPDGSFTCETDSWERLLQFNKTKTFNMYQEAVMGYVQDTCKKLSQAF